MDLFAVRDLIVGDLDILTGVPLHLARDDRGRLHASPRCGWFKGTRWTSQPFAWTVDPSLLCTSCSRDWPPPSAYAPLLHVVLRMTKAREHIAKLAQLEPSYLHMTSLAQYAGECRRSLPANALAARPLVAEVLAAARQALFADPVGPARRIVLAANRNNPAAKELLHHRLGHWLIRDVNRLWFDGINRLTGPNPASGPLLSMDDQLRISQGRAACDRVVSEAEIVEHLSVVADQLMAADAAPTVMLTPVGHTASLTAIVEVAAIEQFPVGGRMVALVPRWAVQALSAGHHHVDSAPGEGVGLVETAALISDGLSLAEACELAHAIAA